MPFTLKRTIKLILKKEEVADIILSVQSQTGLAVVDKIPESVLLKELR